MHLAAENGHANIIELLADKFRASIFERTKDGSTLMHIASLNGHAECAMMLFKKGVYLHMPNKVGVRALLTLCLALSLRGGFNFGLVPPLQGGARSIHTAARYGHVGIINTLLQKGEKVDVTTNVRRASRVPGLRSLRRASFHFAVQAGRERLCLPTVAHPVLTYASLVRGCGTEGHPTQKGFP